MPDEGPLLAALVAGSGRMSSGCSGAMWPWAGRVGKSSVSPTERTSSLTDDTGVVHLYRTTDHGGSWTKLPALPDPAARLSVSNGIITAIVNTDTTHTAWVSADAGSTWTRVFG